MYLPHRSDFASRSGLNGPAHPCPAQFCKKNFPGFSEVFDQFMASGQFFEVATRYAVPCLSFFPPSLFPTPKNFSTGSFSINDSMREGPMNVRPSGFFISEAILATNLLTETPADAVSCSSSLMASTETVRCNLDGGADVLFVLRHIQKRLVQRKGLDQVGIAVKNFTDFFGHLFIHSKTWADKQHFRAELKGFFGGHCGTNTEFSGFIAGSRHLHPLCLRASLRQRSVFRGIPDDRVVQ
jgi:hypothetical protein